MTHKEKWLIRRSLPDYIGSDSIEIANLHCDNSEVLNYLIKALTLKSDTIFKLINSGDYYIKHFYSIQYYYGAGDVFNQVNIRNILMGINKIRIKTLDYSPIVFKK